MCQRLCLCPRDSDQPRLPGPEGRGEASCEPQRMSDTPEYAGQGHPHLTSTGLVSCCRTGPQTDRDSITTTASSQKTVSTTCCGISQPSHRTVCKRWYLRGVANNRSHLLLFVFVLILGLSARPGHCASLSGLYPSITAIHNHSNNEVGAETEDDPLARLSKVFGISRIPANAVHRTPPQYMTELYRSVAYSSGLTRTSGPYNANTVRSFPDRDPVHQLHFFYNVTHLAHDGAEQERMLEAEFHLFKMKPRPSRSAEAPPPHHMQLRVYQVLDMDNMYSPDGLRLLDARRISTHSHGWLTFKVTKAVESWRSDKDPNHGLLVTAQTSSGHFYNGSYIRFAQRNQHHDSKQPIVVVFTDDRTPRHSSFVSPDDTDYQEIQKEMEEEEEEGSTPDDDEELVGAEEVVEEEEETTQAADRPQRTFSRSQDFRQAIFMLNERALATSSPAPTRGRKRRKRESGSGGGKKRRRNGGGGRRKRMYDVGGYRYRRSCARHKMYVDFDEIGWSGWIISPKGYDAYHCSGECPFPLGQSQKPTNHATVQSIVHALRVGNNVGTPCCVPNKLFSISLLYFDDDENVILKQYDDMVAASCGCH